MNILTVRVQPKAKKELVEKINNESYRVKVCSPPDKGQANKRMIALLAKELNIAKGRLTIVKGKAARTKLVRVVCLACMTGCAMIAIGFAVYAQDAPVRVQANVDAQEITIGDRVVYTLCVEHDPDVTVSYPEPGEQLGMFEIKDFSITGPKKEKKKGIVLTQEYVITTFTTGKYEIPALTVSYTQADGEHASVTTDPITIIVNSVMEGEAKDIRPLKNPYQVPRDLRWMWWLIVCVCVCGMIFFGTWWYRRHKKGVLMPPEPPRPPEEIAREALDQLVASALIDQGKVKEYYDRLSDIIRAYIEGRFRIFAIDRTTSELYAEMREKKLDRVHVDIIKRFLDAADLVKFAKLTPDGEGINKDTEKAREIVVITTPVACVVEPVGDNWQKTHAKENKKWLFAHEVMQELKMTKQAIKIWNFLEDVLLARECVCPGIAVAGNRKYY